MALGIIELNDAGIQVATDNGLLGTSPGFAVLDGNKLLVGEEALRNARLLPRWTNNKFWNQLNTDPIPNSTHEIRHHADLAFAHLESLWLLLKDKIDSVILLVPAFYDHQQLGLLLGMVKECGIPVTGVVDSSVIAASEQDIRQTCLHLDIHLHRVTLTTLSMGSTLKRKEVITIAETGIFTLWDRWANIIADQFIQTSRFDPMYEAGSEQALFNQLPKWISNLGDERSNTFELDLGEISHAVAISNDQLMTACMQLYPQIVQTVRAQIPEGEPASLILSHHFTGFPGLKDSLGLIKSIEIIEARPQQSITNALTRADNIIPKDGAISHVISLPSSQKGTHRPHKPVNAASVSGLATHLLIESHAVAIGRSFGLAKVEASAEDGTTSIANDPEHALCTLFPRGDSLQMDVHLADSFLVNGEVPASKDSLKAGDIITIGDLTITLIAVS